MIARHPRCYARGEWIVELQHYLAILGRRPATLAHSFVFARWKLPACFDELRADFEEREGLAAGARQYVRVLQLLDEYSVKVVQGAITHCRQKTTVNTDHIIATVRRLRDGPGPRGDDLPRGTRWGTSLTLPVPTLNHFDQLLLPRQGAHDDHGEQQRWLIPSGTTHDRLLETT